MKVLVAEDSRVVRAILVQALTQWGYEVVIAEDGDQAWRLLDRPDAPAIAILDWIMPGLDGLEVCRRVRASNREPYTYIILLTGKDQQQDIVRGLAAGADDYLKKPFDDGELEARLKTGRRMVELQSQLIAAREALRERAATDPLTGLPNRRTLVEGLDREVERARRGDASCAVAFVDLDHFKRVNDDLGHEAGDAVLKGIVALLGRRSRRVDLLFRMGGEEFLLLLPDTAEEQAAKLAEDLRASIEDYPLLADRRVTVSIGVGELQAGETLDTWLQQADAALYSAKQSGRNRVARRRPAETPADGDLAAGRPQAS
jgi:diguanylate cyclase (GGDEF)-like protein